MVGVRGGGGGGVRSVSADDSSTSILGRSKKFQRYGIQDNQFRQPLLP